jgi:hypothetical protein
LFLRLLALAVFPHSLYYLCCSNLTVARFYLASEPWLISSIFALHMPPTSGSPTMLTVLLLSQCFRSAKDINHMLKHMSQWRAPAPGGGVATVPVMPYLAVLRLKVMMRKWAFKRQHLGLNRGAYHSRMQCVLI